jgi:hypothetical protein
MAPTYIKEFPLKNWRLTLLEVDLSYMHFISTRRLLIVSGEPATMV